MTMVEVSERIQTFPKGSLVHLNIDEMLIYLDYMQAMGLDTNKVGRIIVYEWNGRYLELAPDV